MMQSKHHTHLWTFRKLNKGYLPFLQYRTIKNKLTAINRIRQKEKGVDKMTAAHAQNPPKQAVTVTIIKDMCVLVTPVILWDIMLKHILSQNKHIQIKILIYSLKNDKNYNKCTWSFVLEVIYENLWKVIDLYLCDRPRSTEIKFVLLRSSPRLHGDTASKHLCSTST